MDKVYIVTSDKGGICAVFAKEEDARNFKNKLSRPMIHYYVSIWEVLDNAKTE